MLAILQNSAPSTYLLMHYIGIQKKYVRDKIKGPATIDSIDSESCGINLGLNPNTKVTLSYAP